MGARGDPRAGRGVGRGRPVTSQVGPPRLAPGPRLRLGVHRAAGTGRGRDAPARRGRPGEAPGPAVAGMGRAGARRDLDLRLTHFTAAKRCAVAVLDVVSRYWLSTVVSAEESSTQVVVAFTRALCADGKDHLLDGDLLDELRSGVVPDADELPVLLALSDNGPQMTSKSTKAFLAGARIATHFGRPSTPNDQAWIESLFGHVKTEHPHLEKIQDPGELERELDHPTVLQHGQAPPRRRLRHARRRTHRPRRGDPRRPPRRTATRPRGQACGPASTTTGSPVTAPGWLGFIPPLWCIYSDTPRRRPHHGSPGRDHRRRGPLTNRARQRHLPPSSPTSPTGSHPTPTQPTHNQDQPNPPTKPGHSANDPSRTTRRSPAQRPPHPPLSLGRDTPAGMRPPGGPLTADRAAS